MITNFSLLLIFFCAIISISSKTMSHEDDYFLSVAKAILQNKNNLFETSSTRSKFAYWQGSIVGRGNPFKFENNQGLIKYNWNKEYDDDPNILFNFDFQLFDANYTDQNAIEIPAMVGYKYANLTINQSNGTLIVNNVDLNFHGTKGYTYGFVDLYIYFVDKTTNQAPQTFDISKLRDYTVQFILQGKRSLSLEFSTTLFDTSFDIAVKDTIVLLIGSLVYLGISIASMHHRRNYEEPKVSGVALFLLILFPVYTICYMIVWFVNMTFVLSILPILVFMFYEFFKHLVELFKNGNNGCIFVCFYPIPMLFFVLYPQYGMYVGDLLSSLYLIPQVIMRYQQRKKRERHITMFEVGNWICISLWVYYMNLYPHNVFLTCPKPIVVIIHSAIILIQFGVLAYLEYKYKPVVPRKISEIFRRYTVQIKNTKEKEKLLSTQCAICIEDFEIQSKAKCYKTPCGHFFHAECLKAWGKKQLDCPVCRAKIPAFDG